MASPHRYVSSVFSNRRRAENKNSSVTTMPETPPSQPNPQSGSDHVGPMIAPSSPSKKHRKDLPPLLWYMEMGHWDKATARAQSHPKEVKTRATLRTKSTAAMDNSSNHSSDSNNNNNNKGTQRLALHHACFKLRSAGSSSVMAHKASAADDPYLKICEFILLILKIYPEAAGIRETRHGCLPLHLAAFASCAPRPPSDDDDLQLQSSSSTSPQNNGSSHSSSTHSTNSHNNGFALARPKHVQLRSCSESTADTVHSNMTAILAEERLAATQTMRKVDGKAIPTSVRNRVPNNIPPPVAVPPHILSSTTEQQHHNQEQQQQLEQEEPQLPTAAQTIFISNKREEIAVKVLNALLDAYPRAIRLDSEGGRLPLHTACAGRATPRCVSMLLRAYPAAARHRNKDGFLPLHLAAHWGVSHPNVAITLLKAYPDATVGRNRWERTPLEEALCMAGENGRPYQAPLVRALRKHPSYWTRPPKELFATTNLDGHRTGSPHLVDIDATLASGDDDDDETDDNPRYFNSGHSHSLLEQDDYENVPEGETTTPCQQNIGLFGRFRGRAKVDPADVDISLDLPTLIRQLKWKSVLARLDCNPDDACEELIGVTTRGGFTANASMTPLHYACERKPPVEVVQALMEANPEAINMRMMPGGCLPLHIACTWHAPPVVISTLLAADPSTAKVVDELGNRPLHAACFSGHIYPVIQDLLSSYPKAVLSRNNQGSQPIDICRRLRHPNRRVVMGALVEKKERVLAKHKRSQSSGSYTDIAESAARMNQQERGIPGLNSASFDHLGEAFVGEGGGLPGGGVEVTYNEHDGTQALLWI